MERVETGGSEQPQAAGRDNHLSEAVRGADEAKFATAFRMASVLMTISSMRDGRLLEVNDAFCEGLGYERPELIGRPVTDLGILVDPGIRELITKGVREHGIVRDIEIAGRRSDGSVLRGSLAASSIEVDGEPCLLTAIIDVTDRLAAQDALRASERRFATAFTSAGVMMLIVRALDGTIVDVNRAFLKETGYEREDVIGRTSQELPLFADPGDRDRLVQGIRENGRVWDLEVRLVGRAGEVIHALLSADPIMLEGVPHLISTVTNTTERRLAVEALRASEARYRNLVEQVADGVLSLDDEGRIVDANPAMAQLLGRPIEELRGALWTGFIEPANLAEAPDQTPSLDTIRPTVFERRMCRPDGSVVELEIHARRVGQGLMLGTARDIGVRKAADRERAMLTGAIEQAADSIAITDAAGTIVYVNPSFEKETGFTRDEVTGQNHRALHGAAFPPDFNTVVFDTVARDGTWSGEVLNRTRHGSTLRQAITVSGIRDSSGALANYVVVQRNITRERELEDQLRQAQKMEAVGRLAGGVAHDFNNLLTAISGFTELATREAVPGSELAGHLDEIGRSAERATVLTRQLLVFGRRAVLRSQVIDLNRVVTELAPMLQRIIGEHIRLEVGTGAALSRTLADPGQLEQVVVNLAVNARDAMPGGGKLTIETENVDLDDVYAAEHPEVRPGRYVRLSISDTGAGMDAETVEHIFEPFFTTKGPGRGTGLGLATVFGIVRQSGGQVGVASMPGQGSTFRIDLPAIAAEPDETHAAVSPSTAAPGRETVLVVEDEPAVLRFAAQLLERNGYTVIRAANGDEAVDLARKYSGRIDLVFSDLVMPGLTGQETAAAVKAARPEIRRLFASGYSEEMNVGRNQHAAAHPFVAKPYAGDVLLRAIREALAED